MHRTTTNLLTALLLFISLAVFSELNAQNLNNYRWKNRILIVQTSEQSNPEFKSQIAEFEGQAEALQNRKLIIYKVVEGNYQLADYSNKKDTTSWKPLAKGLKDNVNEKVAFQITLIGLDGGIKLQQTDVLKSSELFDTIDAMPMRSSELRRKKGK